MSSEHYQQIITWIKQDALRMRALRAARQLGLQDWCLAAGFVRNMVWDRLHGYPQDTPLNDIDLIYFNAQHCDEKHDSHYQQHLSEVTELPWSVKNQARMHHRHDHPPYQSSREAMSYWVENETAIGVTLSQEGDISVIAPLGTDSLFNLHISPNPRHGNPQVLLQRAQSKAWLNQWPMLKMKI
jgi:hypothetical protein